MAIYMSITLEGGGMDANSCVILSPGYLILEAGSDKLSSQHKS